MVIIIRILVIGLGLMGGSVAQAAKKAGYYVAGYNRTREASEYAFVKGFIDEIAENPYDKFEEDGKYFDVCIIGSTLGSYENIFKEMNNKIHPETIITDMGSLKALPMMWAKEYASIRRRFFGGHPMAGSEKNGVEHSDGRIFKDKKWFITEYEDSIYSDVLKKEDMIETLLTFLEAIGALPEFIEPEEHDRCAAAASHLPQSVSVIMCSALRNKKHDRDFLKIAENGFRDVSRLGGSSFGAWKDTLLLNKKNIISELDAVIKETKNFTKALEENDEESLMKIFERSNKTRAEFLNKHKAGKFYD